MTKYKLQTAGVVEWEDLRDSETGNIEIFPTAAAAVADLGELGTDGFRAVPVEVDDVFAMELGELAGSMASNSEAMEHNPFKDYEWLAQAWGCGFEAGFYSTL